MVCVCAIQPAIPSICVVFTGLGTAQPPPPPPPLPLFHQKAVTAEEGGKTEAAGREKNTALRKLEHRCFFSFCGRPRTGGAQPCMRSLNGRGRKYWAVKRLAPRETNIRCKHVKRWREGGEKGGKTLITWNYLLGFDTEGLVQNLCGGCDDIQGWGSLTINLLLSCSVCSETRSRNLVLRAS